MNAGMATAARMPMIATTIISSIKVKPLWTFFMRRIESPSCEEVYSKPRARCQKLATDGKRAEVFVTPHDHGAENCHWPRRTSLGGIFIVSLVDAELLEPVAQRAK